jgi:hypothetical protein
MMFFFFQLTTKEDKYVVTSDRDNKIRISNYPNSYSIHTYCLQHAEWVKINPVVHNVPVRIFHSIVNSISFNHCDRANFKSTHICSRKEWRKLVAGLGIKPSSPASLVRSSSHWAIHADIHSTYSPNYYIPSSLLK